MNQLIGSNYDDLTPRAKENIKHRIRIGLNIYLKIKDLLIHDIRSFVNSIYYEKLSKDVLDRLTKTNLNIIRDVLDVSYIKLKYNTNLIFYITFNSI